MVAFKTQLVELRFEQEKRTNVYIGADGKVVNNELASTVI